MISNRCFERQELLDYLQGFTEEPAAAQLETHVESCKECESHIEQLEQGESVSDVQLEGLNNFQSAEEFSSQSRIDQVIQLIKDQRPSDQDSQNGQKGNLLPSGLLYHTGTELGSYRLKEMVGRGGMAVVYKAEHTKLKKEVAIKILCDSAVGGDSSVDRIQREIETIGKLDHPAIVTATDAGEYEGATFLVTEFIDGLDLKKIVDREGKLSVADACGVIRKAAQGIAVAHGEGFVHRDLKPSNMMLDKSGNLKILDFGLVRNSLDTSRDLELTTVGQLLGTLDYMAPEQAENANSADHKSDVYSLAATLFCLLTGRAPYAMAKFQSPLEKLRLLANHCPPKIKTLLPNIPNKLANIIDSCLSRQPEERLPSALHLAEALEPFCGEENLSELIQSALEKPDPKTSQNTALAESPAFLTKGFRSNSSRGNGIWWKVALALFFFGFAYLSIILVIQTKQGEIIIQTDTAGISAKILKDGKEYKEVKLVNGVNKTKLYAGKYEIIIDAPTDNFEINQNTWNLKQGQTVVATITQKASKSDLSHKSSGMTTGGSVAKSSDAKTDAEEIELMRFQSLTYEGKTILEWLTIAGRETSPKVVAGAALSIRKIVDTSESNVLRRYVVKRVFQLPIPSNKRYFSVLYWPDTTRSEDAKWLVNESNPKSSEDFVLISKWINGLAHSLTKSSKPDPERYSKQRQELCDLVIKHYENFLSHHKKEANGNSLEFLLPVYNCISQVESDSFVGRKQWELEQHLKNDELLTADAALHTMKMWNPPKSKSDSYQRHSIEKLGIRLLESRLNEVPINTLEFCDILDVYRSKELLFDQRTKEILRKKVKQILTECLDQKKLDHYLSLNHSARRMGTGPSLDLNLLIDGRNLPVLVVGGQRMGFYRLISFLNFLKLDENAVERELVQKLSRTLLENCKEFVDFSEIDRIQVILFGSRSLNVSFRKVGNNRDETKSNYGKLSLEMLVALTLCSDFERDVNARLKLQKSKNQSNQRPAESNNRGLQQTSSVSDKNRFHTNLMYQGKSLDQWFEIINTEVNSKKTYVAAHAITGI